LLRRSRRAWLCWRRHWPSEHRHCWALLWTLWQTQPAADLTLKHLTVLLGSRLSLLLPLQLYTCLSLGLRLCLYMGSLLRLHLRLTMESFGLTLCRGSILHRTLLRILALKAAYLSPIRIVASRDDRGPLILATQSFNLLVSYRVHVKVLIWLALTGIHLLALGAGLLIILLAILLQRSSV